MFHATQIKRLIKSVVVLVDYLNDAVVKLYDHIICVLFKLCLNIRNWTKVAIDVRRVPRIYAEGRMMRQSISQVKADVGEEGLRNDLQLTAD